MLIETHPWWKFLGSSDKTLTSDVFVALFISQKAEGRTSFGATISKVPCETAQHLFSRSEYSIHLPLSIYLVVLNQAVILYFVDLICIGTKTVRLRPYREC
jgi:hypothetical protein